MGEVTKPPLSGLQAIVDLMSDGACLVDPEKWQVVFANPSLLKAFGSEAGVAAGTPISLWLPDLRLPEGLEQLATLVSGQAEHATLLSRFGVTERSRRVEVRIRRVETESRMLLAMVIRFVPAVESNSGPPRDGADPLTGLADRAMLLERLAKLVGGERSGDECGAVLFIDVDGFKQVNDTYGHLMGDGVLCEVARRLTECVRGGDLVARFGGDEFVVLLERVGSRAEIEVVLRRIEATFARSIPVAQSKVTLGVSIGSALAGVDGSSPEDLINAADRAMYAAKRAPV